jgi:hypothetical protein
MVHFRLLLFDYAETHGITDLLPGDLVEEIDLIAEFIKQCDDVSKFNYKPSRLLHLTDDEYDQHHPRRVIVPAIGTLAVHPMDELPVPRDFRQDQPKGYKYVPPKVEYITDALYDNFPHLY